MPRVRIRVRSAAPVSEPEETGPGVGTAVAGTAGLALVLGLAARRPGLISRGLRGLNAVRLQGMLSGFAVPKSILGNIGATAIAAGERRSLEPLRQLFSRQTLRDLGTAYKAGGSVGPTPGVGEYARIPVVPTPGRIMGSVDVATRQALQRAGLSESEAAREILQTPLTGNLAEAFEGNPAATLVVPFRRTPFNQFIEGLETLKPSRIREHPGVFGTVTGAGAALGAGTAEKKYPVSVPLGVAASARYGMPFALAALIGRQLAGGRTSAGIASQVIPVSEYGVETGVTDPLGSIREPALKRALERLLGIE